jgi:chemotaxis regulatin CheY-phosphate phosphatase CheZ
MTGLQRLNRALLGTLMKPEAANIVADRLEEIEAETKRLREAIKEIDRAARFALNNPMPEDAPDILANITGMTTRALRGENTQDQTAAKGGSQ